MHNMVLHNLDSEKVSLKSNKRFNSQSKSIYQELWQSSRIVEGNSKKNLDNKYRRCTTAL